MTGKAQSKWWVCSKAAKTRALARLVADRHSELWNGKAEPARLDVARILIESGANPLGEWAGELLVAVAACRACPSMVALLVEKGADPDQKGAGGKSARDYLAMMRLRYEERGMGEQLERALWARSRRVSAIEVEELNAQWAAGSGGLSLDQKSGQARGKRL